MEAKDVMSLNMAIKSLADAMNWLTISSAQAGDKNITIMQSYELMTKAMINLSNLGKEWSVE